MYNAISIPLDGSKRAEAILPHVEDMAGRYGATVIFLRVVEPVPLNVGLEGAYTVLQEEFERRTEQVAFRPTCIDSHVQGLTTNDAL